MNVWEPINKGCLWLIHLAWLNSLWIIFTLLGLGLFGWAPATTTLLSVIRKQMLTEGEIPIFQAFWQSYKRDFIKANVMGFIVVMGLSGLWLSLGTLSDLDLTIRIVMGTWFLLITCLFSIVAIFIFPVFTYFDTTIKNYFHYALLIGLSHLHYLIMIIAMLVGLYGLFNLFPGLLLFFAFSLPAQYVMYLSAKTFEKIEN